MDKYVRHQRIWQGLYFLLHRPIERKFNLTSEICEAEGPCIVIPNHVTNWDPFLVAMSFPHKQMYYVASEHIFRLKFVSKLINWFMAPIARRKGDVGSDTVREILRHVKNGHSVCLFAEGDCCWSGENSPVLPATGKLVKVSGASLVTYRLEGGYFTMPRWGKGVRRGKMHGHPVGIYSPETLKKMTAEEVTALIDRDIREDAWARQAKEPVEYRGKRTAEHMETALFLCPKCRRIGTLKGVGDRLICRSCGLSVTYRPDGSFFPAKPFSNMREWDEWQHRALSENSFEHGSELFFDEGVTLSRVLTGHRARKLPGKRLTQLMDRLRCGKEEFLLEHIGDMAMVQKHILLFRYGKDYYEVRASKDCNLRKYLAVWKDAAKSTQ